MTDNLKTLFIFSFGAAVGSIVTFLGVKKYYEVKADLEVESVREAYDRRLNEIEPIKTSVDGDITGPSVIDDKKGMIGGHSSIVEKLNNKPPLKDYTKYFKAETTPNMSEEEETKLAESETPPEDEPYSDEEDEEQTLAAQDALLNGEHKKAIAEDREPYVIDRGDYELTCAHYDKINLLYYVSDDILCEDDNSEVNRFDLVGNLIASTGFDENSDEELLVRNDKLTSDFEITKIYTDYGA